jgi:hypothetical protein
MIQTYLTVPATVGESVGPVFKRSAQNLSDTHLVKAIHNALLIFRVLQDAETIVNIFNWEKVPQIQKFATESLKYEAQARLVISRRVWLNRIATAYQNHHQRIVYRGKRIEILDRQIAETLIVIPSRPPSCYREGVKYFQVKLAHDAEPRWLLREELLILDEGEWLVNMEFHDDPGTWMWIGYLDALRCYINSHNQVAASRIINTKLAILKHPKEFEVPWWCYSSVLTQSHRAQLLNKLDDWYEARFTETKENPQFRRIYPAGKPKLKQNIEAAIVELIKRSRQFRKETDNLPKFVVESLCE